MPFAALSLAVVNGSIGRGFASALVGAQDAARYAVRPNPAGFYFINGEVRHTKMPAGTSSFTVRERIPGEGFEDTTFTVTATSRDVLDDLASGTIIPPSIAAAGNVTIPKARPTSKLVLATNPDNAWSLDGNVLSWSSSAVGKAGRPTIVETATTPEGPIQRATRFPIGAGVTSTVTPGPALALSSIPPSLTVGSPPGILVANIGNVPANVTPAVVPNDGRLIIAGDAVNGWKVVLGMSALSVGTIGFSVTAAGASSAAATITIAAAGAPDAPTVTLGSSDGRVSISWVDGSGNGSTIASHQIYSGPTANNLQKLVLTTSAPPYANTGLPNGVERWFAVSAVNSDGLEGPRSIAKPATPSAAIAQLTNPAMGFLGSSRGRQMANNPNGGDDVTSKGGGYGSFVSFLDPRIGTILFQAPNDAWTNSAGMGGTLYANDGDGFERMEARIPRIIASGVKIIFIDMTSNSIQNTTTLLIYTNYVKKLATLLRDAGIVVVIGSCVHRNSAAGGAWGINSFGRSLVIPANAEVKNWASTQQNIEFVDIQSLFTDPNNNYEPFTWAVRDGTHYTPLATWMLAKLIVAAVAKYIVGTTPYNPVITNLHPNPTLSGDVAIPASSSTTNITGTLPTGLVVAWDSGGAASTKDSKVAIARVAGTNRWRMTIDRSAMVSNVEGVFITLSAPPSFSQGKSYQAFLDVNFEPSSDGGWTNIGSLSIRHGGETATGIVPMTSSETPLGDFDGTTGLPMPPERMKGRMWSPELRCIAAGTSATVYRNPFWWKKGDQTPLQVEFENPILAEVRDGRQIYFNVANTDAPVFTSPATISFPEESPFQWQITTNRAGVHAISGADSALFNLDRNSGKMTAISGVLDYDQDRSPTYNVTDTFTPYDYRQSPIVQNLVINLTDIDDGFTDLFTGTTGAFLDQRPGWTLVSGVSGALIINGNRVTADTTKGIGAVAAQKVGDTPNQEVKFTLSSNSSGPTGVLKMIDYNNFIGLRCGSGTLRFTCNVNNVTAFQAVLPTHSTPSSNTPLIAQQIDNVIRIYQSDALIYTLDMNTLTQAQIPDVLRNTKISGVITQGAGSNIGIDTWNNGIATRRADKIWLKPLTAATTGTVGVDYASDIVDNGPTENRSLQSVTGPNTDVIVDGLTLRVQKPVAGRTTVQVKEEDPNAANSGRISTIIIDFA